MLVKLSAELLKLIVHNIRSHICSKVNCESWFIKIIYHINLKSLCEICKYLYNIIISLLYESLTILTMKLSIENLIIKLKEISFQHLTHIRNICFSTSICNYLKSHCIHWNNLCLENEAVKLRIDKITKSMKINNMSRKS